MSTLKAQLGAVVASDLDFACRGAGDAAAVWREKLDELTGLAAAAASDAKLVYTAFDGDHQQMTPLMRQACLREGKVPVNPDSVLEYKETALARGSKREVLLDDLAILRRCDELWIFSDLDPEVPELHRLAEGVLVELLFFLKRKPASPVYFCSARGLLKGDNCRKTRLEASYDAVKTSLPDNVRQDVLSLANSGTVTDEALPHPVYFITDPLDFKYARFILPRVYQTVSATRRFVPVVPQLAVPVGDLGPGLPALGETFLCWLRLATIGSSCVHVSSLESGRKLSGVSEITRRFWLRGGGAATVTTESWHTYGVPRAKLGRLWPITSRERNIAAG